MTVAITASLTKP